MVVNVLANIRGRMQINEPWRREMHDDAGLRNMKLSCNYVTTTTIAAATMLMPFNGTSFSHLHLIQVQVRAQLVLLLHFSRNKSATNCARSDQHKHAISLQSWWNGRQTCNELQFMQPQPIYYCDYSLADDSMAPIRPIIIMVCISLYDCIWKPWYRTTCSHFSSLSQ